MNSVAILYHLFVRMPFNWAVKPAVEDSKELTDTHSPEYVASLIFLLLFLYSSTESSKLNGVTDSAS